MREEVAVERVIGSVESPFDAALIVGIAHL
jgi:hypothetical protein